MCAFWLKKCSDPLRETMPFHNDRKLLKEGFYGRILLKCKVLEKGAGKLSVCAPYRILDSDNEICKVQVRGADNLPVIPGTSVKGVIRSVCEALSPSCVLGSGNECEVSNGKLCMVCSIFGALGYRGRICFSDVVFKACAPEKIKVYIQRPPQKPRGDIKFYSETSEKSYIGNNRRSISKERIEGLIAPKEGSFYLCVEGLRDWELGLLFLAMGVSKKYSWDLRIGYARNQGLGWVKFSVEKAFLSKGIGANPKNIKDQVDDFVNRYLEEIRRKRPVDISRIQGNIKLLKRYWGS